MNQAVLERTARAMCRTGLVDYMVTRDGNDGAIKWAEDRFGSVDGYVEAHWRDHLAGALEVVLAVLRSVREPSEGMVYVGIQTARDCTDNWTAVAPCVAEHTWPAMVDARIAELEGRKELDVS